VVTVKKAFGGVYIRILFCWQHLARWNYMAQIIHYELLDVFLVLFFIKNIKKTPDLNKKVYKV